VDTIQTLKPKTPINPNQIIVKNIGKIKNPTHIQASKIILPRHLSLNQVPNANAKTIK
jgi:hypothetical protein